MCHFYLGITIGFVTTVNLFWKISQGIYAACEPIFVFGKPHFLN